MQLAPHLPKQPIFTVLDRQTCFHRLSQVTRTQQTKDRPAKIPDPPYAAQCCAVLRSAAARSTLCSTLSCSLTGKWRTIFFSPARSTDPRRRPVQRADRPRSHRRLLPRPRRPPTDRGPRTTGRHGSPTAMVDGHCHLPHSDQLPTPPGGVQLAQESRSSVFRCSHAYNFNVNPNRSACNGEWQFGSLVLIYHARIAAMPLAIAALPQ